MLSFLSVVALDNPCSFDAQIAEFLTSDSMARLGDQVSTVSANIGAYSAGFALSGVALYAVMWTVAFVTGSQNGDVLSFLKWFTRALIIISVAGTGSLYSDYVIDTFWATPAEVAQYVIDGGMVQDGLSYDLRGKVNFGTALDTAANRGVCAGTSIWQATTTWDLSKSLGYFLAGLVVVLGVVLFVALAAGLSFIGYASLAIVLTLGPLFIILGIWDATKPMMEAWVRTAMNYAIYGIVLMVIVGLAIGLVISFGAEDMESIKAGTLDLAGALRLAVRALFAFGIASALLFKADDISASIVGGISLGAIGSLTKAAAVAASPAKAAKEAGKIAANPAKAVGEFMGGTYQTQRDPRTGAMTQVYKSRAETARDYASALTHTRAKNPNGIKQ